jgi:hypothetical protein
MTRKEIALEAYNEKKIGADTLGFLAIGGFSDATINEAYERKYISCGIAGNLLTTKND